MQSYICDACGDQAEAQTGTTTAPDNWYAVNRITHNPHKFTQRHVCSQVCLIALANADMEGRAVTAVPPQGESRG